MQSAKWSLLPKGRCPKINFATTTVFETYKFQKPLWPCLGMPDNAHLKLHDQSVALINMKFHAQNQLYTSISFWDFKALKSSLGIPGYAWHGPDHTHLNLHNQFITFINMKLHAPNKPPSPILLKLWNYLWNEDNFDMKIRIN